ncbi:hypothetical protein FACS1894202_06910 [Clostridia bacterium]|nr:hypothetical protein FACS1894202_06910 [Clostridia bacterium]
MKQGISKTLIVTVLIVTVLGLGILTAVSAVLTYRLAKDEAIQVLEEKGDSLSAELNGWIDKHMTRVAINASSVEGAPELTRDVLASVLATQINYKETNGECLEIYVGWADGLITTATGWTPDPATWKANERGWYKQAAASAGNVVVTDPYVDSNTGELCLSFARTVGSNANIGVSAIDLQLQTLDDFVAAANTEPDSVAFLVDGNDNILIHPDSKYAPGKDGSFKKLSDITDTGKQFTVSSSVPLAGWRVISSESESAVLAPVYNVILVMVIIFIVTLIAVVVVLQLRISRSVVKPIHAIIDAMNEIEQGSIEVELSSKFVGEFGQLAASLTSIIVATRGQASAIESIASGDYSVNYTPRSDKDMAGQALVNLLTKNNEVFADINSATVQVSQGSRQIADGAQGLAQGSTQQAAAVEQLSSSISEIAHKTKENAEQAGRAASLSEAVRRNAEKGSHQMGDMIQAVREINDASHNIQKVIKVIDDIAFQTNILALNAAVEAARAGQHGKGFAVVAEEVRNLAAKSASAASDTGTLIANSMEKAELGAKIAGETAASLTEIVEGINESSQIVSNIAVSSEEQSLAIGQINNGIDQVAQVVQQNSATAEESAATAEELSGQSSLLEELINQFKLKGDSGTRKSVSGGARAKKTLAMPAKTDSYGSGDFGKY